MAAPSAPTGVKIHAGKHPGEVVVQCAAVGGATSYTAYVHPQATVSNLLYTGKRSCASPIIKFRGMKTGGENKQVNAVMTVTTAGGTSTPSAVVKCTPFQNPGLGTGGANA